MKNNLLHLLFILYSNVQPLSGLKMLEPVSSNHYQTAVGYSKILGTFPSRQRIQIMTPCLVLKSKNLLIFSLPREHTRP